MSTSVNCDTTLVMSVQLAKDREPRKAILAGSVMDTRPLCANAQSPMCLIPSGSATAFKFKHPRKASSPILWSVFGSVMDTNQFRFRNVSDGISVQFPVIVNAIHLS